MTSYWLEILGLAFGVVTTIATAFFWIGRLLSSQIKENLDARFNALSKQQADIQTHTDNRFNTLQNSLDKNNDETMRIERELMSLKAALPEVYVRREDYIRNQSIIESKLDGLAIKFENALLKLGAKHD